MLYKFNDRPNAIAEPCFLDRKFPYSLSFLGLDENVKMLENLIENELIELIQGLT